MRALKGLETMSRSGRNIGSARGVLQGSGSTEKGSAYFADLIESIARNKNRDAFAELFEYFAPRLKGYLLRLGTSEGQAEEVAQEAMLSVWRKAHLFNRKLAAPSTWIFTIARNRRIDILRRQRFPEIDPHDPTLVPENPPQPDDEIIVARQGESVRAALENLPDEQRELVRLAFYSGWSHSEIANRTNLPLGTVKSRLRLAFARLRNELDDRL